MFPKNIHFLDPGQNLVLNLTLPHVDVPWLGRITRKKHFQRRTEEMMEERGLKYSFCGAMSSGKMDWRGSHNCGHHCIKCTLERQAIKAGLTNLKAQKYGI